MSRRNSSRRTIVHSPGEWRWPATLRCRPSRHLKIAGKYTPGVPCQRECLEKAVIGLDDHDGRSQHHGDQNTVPDALKNCSYLIHAFLQRQLVLSRKSRITVFLMCRGLSLLSNHRQLRTSLANPPGMVPDDQNRRPCL